MSERRARNNSLSSSLKIPLALVVGSSLLLALTRPSRELATSIAVIDVCTALSFLPVGFIAARRLLLSPLRTVWGASFLMLLLRFVLLTLLFLTLPTLSMPLFTLRASAFWLLGAWVAGLLGVMLGSREGFSTVFLYEARLLFRTPVTWAMLAGFALLAGASFLAYIDAALEARGVTIGSLGAAIFIPTIQEQANLLLFLTPVIALRYTKANGNTYQALPVRPAEVILGQFAACVLPVLLASATPLFFPLALGSSARVPLLGAFIAGLGLVLVSLTACAMGLFFANLSRSALGSGGMGLFFVLGVTSVQEHAPTLVNKSLLSLLSLSLWFEPFSKGVFDIRSVAYFVSLCAMTLFVTIRVEEMRRWT
jgi:ABC-2 type transport system permease protein